MPSSCNCYEQMVNRCTQVHCTWCTQYRFIWYMQYSRHQPGTYKFRYSQVQLGLPQSPMVPSSPHCGPQLPKHSICPARRHHYGTNMVTIIILPLSPASLNLSLARFTSNSRPLPLLRVIFLSFSSPSPVHDVPPPLLEGFVWDRLPSFGKLSERKKKGYKKWPISWLALN